MDASGSVGFNDWVDGQVTQLIHLGETNFASLVSRLPGIYPDNAFAALQRLRAGSADLNGHPQALIDSSRVDRPAESWESVELGLLHPHPLDFEWRFRRHAVEILADRCNKLTGPLDHIALVATPTLAMTQDRIFGRRLLSYIGADTAGHARNAWPPHIRIARHVDLLQLNSRGRRYAAVIMDPPWYDEHLLRFLWFAATSTQRNGVLLLAMPAIGTRPGILEEHVRNREWCGRLGFELEQVDCGVLPYETPLFERNALRAAGILNVPSDWRRGDLWILRKTRANRARWPGDIGRTSWSEHRFGQVRLRVDRGVGDQGASPALVSLVPGDVLPTVSRRDVRRPNARVWTTGNRIFGCSAPEELGRILDDWQTGSETATVDSEVKRAVIAQVSAILEVEGNEVDRPNTKRST